MKAADSPLNFTKPFKRIGPASPPNPCLSPQNSVQRIHEHGVEDFAWSSSGTLLAARDAKLYAYRPDRDFEWIELADLAEHGVGPISRVVIEPNGSRLLFVAASAPPAGEETGA